MLSLWLFYMQSLITYIIMPARYDPGEQEPNNLKVFYVCTTKDVFAFVLVVFKANGDSVARSARSVDSI